MTLHLNDYERGFLLELLEAAHREKLRELSHTDSPAYKGLLRERIAIVEALTARLVAAEHAA